MIRSHRWAVVLCVAAGLVPLSPPRTARCQDAQAGVEVQARGPVHEAFASLAGDPAPTKAIAKQPPAPLDEQPPEERPDGDVIWISGYWAFDDDRDDFLWVSGLWRTVPPGRQWVAGYWREDGQQWQWVPGFWTGAKEKQEEQQMTYLAQPPELPKVAPPGKPPTEESFYVPGIWVWNGTGYAWRAGYWAKVQPGWTWTPDHYRWTPSGYVFIAGYWDLAVSKRGILYAPVYVSPAVRVSYTYTPAYAVRDTIIVDTLFVQPATCHYYFGDYYEVRYQERGYQSCVVYSQTRYDSIVVYERYERRRDPAWFSVQINLYNDRCAGRAAVPPRVVNQTVINQTVVNNNTTIVQNNVTNVNNVNNVNVNNTTVNNTRNVNNNLSAVAPTKTVVQNKNVNMVKVDEATRTQAKAQAQAVQAVSKQRSTAERSSPPTAGQVRTTALSVPKTQPVKQGMVAPKAVTTPPSTANVAHVNNANVAKAANVNTTNNAGAKPNTPANTTNPAVKSANVAGTKPANTGNNANVAGAKPANVTNTAQANTAGTKPNVPANATNNATKTPAVNTAGQRPANNTAGTNNWLPAVPANKNGQPTQQPGAARTGQGTQAQGTTQPKQPAVQPKTTQPPRRPAPAPKDKDKDKDKR
jgi:hypothetical protein